MSWPAGLGVPKRRLERLEGGFRVFACGVRGAKKAFGSFGGFEAWQTAGLNAKKKLLMWPWCLGLRSWGCQKGIWSFGGFEAWQAAGLNAKKKLLMWPAGLGVPKRHLERLEGGFGVFACVGRGAKKAFGGFGVFEAWQTAPLNAKKKLLIGPWCLCLQGSGCQKGVWKLWRV